MRLIDSSSFPPMVYNFVCAFQKANSDIVDAQLCRRAYDMSTWLYIETREAELGLRLGYHDAATSASLRVLNSEGVISNASLALVNNYFKGIQLTPLFSTLEGHILLPGVPLNVLLADPTETQLELDL